MTRAIHLPSALIALALLALLAALLAGCSAPKPAASSPLLPGMTKAAPVTPAPAAVIVPPAPTVYVSTNYFTQPAGPEPVFAVGIDAAPTPFGPWKEVTSVPMWGLKLSTNRDFVFIVSSTNFAEFRKAFAR